jgi:hypothetical protein
MGDRSAPADDLPNSEGRLLRATETQTRTWRTPRDVSHDVGRCAANFKSFEPGLRPTEGRDRERQYRRNPTVGQSDLVSDYQPSAMRCDHDISVTMTKTLDHCSFAGWSRKFEALLEYGVSVLSSTSCGCTFSISGDLSRRCGTKHRRGENFENQIRRDSTL